MNRVLFALLMACATLTATARARADDSKQLQVLAIYSDDAFQQAQALTIALKRAVTRADNWALAEGDFSLEVMTAALNCPVPPEQECLKKIESQLNTKRFIWGTMVKKGDKVVAKLRYWDSGPQSDAEITYAANLTEASDDTLLQIARDALNKTTGTGTGKLVIESGGVAGDLLIGGEVKGTISSSGTGELELEAGEYEITLRPSAAGWGEAAATVTVTPGDTTRIELKPQESAKAKGSGKVALDTTDAGTGMSQRRMMAYGALGLGGLFIAGGVYSALQVSSIDGDDGFDAYRRGFDSGTDVCDAADAGRESTVGGAITASEAADKCSSASTFQTLQFVFFGLGLVSGGVGTYLLLTEEEPKKAKAGDVHIGGDAGPGRGRVSVRVAF